MRSLPHRDIGQSLYEALRTGKSITTLTERYPEMSIDDAYKISLAFLKTRQSKNKEVVIGKKIGVTSKPVQDMLGVFQPDFGFLTNTMLANDGRVHMDCHVAVSYTHLTLPTIYSV